MLPLRFPNSGIRAKAARRRGGQSPSRAGHPRPGQLRPRHPTRGRPATAKAPLRGSRQHARSPAGMAGAYRGGTCRRRQCPWPGRRGWLSTTRLKGAAPWPGLSPTRVAAPAGAVPSREVPPEGSSAYLRGAAHTDSMQRR
ncbi:hypothetical protein BHM03_00026744 [Ensete ventricosum]|uniref:Uncharacterized protein n=1 Tax=Ensete ventricosum TaxID=4639 RepID=A0A445MHC2_ENSVE|nr:hypothetical protein BHM03_00026744 [Ensete ventricosum]